MNNSFVFVAAAAFLCAGCATPLPPDDANVAAAGDGTRMMDFVNADGRSYTAYGGEFAKADGEVEAEFLTLKDLDTMSFRDKLDLYNSVADKNDRIVCRRELPTGSHVKRQVCRSVLQMELEEEWARNTLQKAIRMDSLLPFGFRHEGTPPGR